MPSDLKLQWCTAIPPTHTHLKVLSFLLGLPLTSVESESESVNYSVVSDSL